MTNESAPNEVELGRIVIDSSVKDAPMLRIWIGETELVCPIGGGMGWKLAAMCNSLETHIFEILSAYVEAKSETT